MSRRPSYPETSCGLNIRACSMWSLVDSEAREREGAVGTTESKTGFPLYEVQMRPNSAPARTGQGSRKWNGKYAPVNYHFQFSGPVTALRARAGTRAKFKIDCPLNHSTPKSSHGSVTPAPKKLLPTGDISHGLARVELSSINSLPFQLDRYINFSLTPLSINC